MVEDFRNIINNYHRDIKEKAQFHAGYPVNFEFDYSELLSLFEVYLNNLGDPFITSNSQMNSRDFERKVLAFFAELYYCKNWWGYITSSGTEGNLYGILLGRETYPNGILYASADSHYSLNKASRFFKIPHVVVDSKSNGEMNYENFKNQLQLNYPAIINLNIGTTLKGAVDNIDKILEILESKQIKQFYIHCDGALGGMLIPYLAPDLINFKRPIHSLAISGHKFIGCPFPCGIILTYKVLADQLAANIEYIGSKDTTMGGSRNGHAPIFLWYSIQKRKGLFKQEAVSCISKAIYLYNQLEKAGLSCLLNSYSTTVVFPKPAEKVVKKWQLATQGNLAHVVVMQNHSDNIIDDLIFDIVNSDWSLN